MSLSTIIIILVVIITLTVIGFLDTHRCRHEWADIWTDVEVSDNGKKITVAQRCEKCGLVRTRNKRNPKC